MIQTSIEDLQTKIFDFYENVNMKNVGDKKCLFSVANMIMNNVSKNTAEKSLSIWGFSSGSSSTHRSHA